METLLDTACSDSLFPDWQKDEEDDPETGKYASTEKALKHNLLLQSPQVPILDPQPPVKNHEARDLVKDSAAFGQLLARVVEPLPRQPLAAIKQQEEEAATPKSGQDEAHPQPPQRPRCKGLPTGVGAAERGETPDEDYEEAGDGADDAEQGGDADSLEGAVADAEADEVAVRAVAEQAVDVIGDRFQGNRVGRDVQVCDGLLAERGRDVELLFGSGQEEEVDDGVEFAAGDWAGRIRVRLDVGRVRGRHALGFAA